jgi:hypothetical protein
VASPPATPPAALPEAVPAARNVSLNYTFPASLGDGEVEILLRDAEGTRVVLAPTPSASVAGATAQQDGLQVRGEAVFLVRLNGQEIASIPAR